jgi:hypothetical protein
MLAAWNQRKQARATTCGNWVPPCSASMTAESRPDSLKTVSAAATSGIIRTRSPSKVGSSRSLRRLCGAKSRSAIRAETSRNASKVSRECSAKRSRAVSASTSSHS